MEHDYFYVKYAIDKQGRYYLLAKSNETFKSRTDAINSAAKLPEDKACTAHLLGPYFLVLKKPRHFKTDSHLQKIGAMFMRFIEAEELLRSE